MMRWLGNLVVMAVGLAIGLVCLEVGVRMAGFQPPSSRADRVIGYRNLPNARYHHLGEEGASDGRFNAAGWRDVDHAEARPGGTTRILILGDSFVSAFQVPLDSTFHRRLERALNARALPGRHFEVIALGQDGNSTTAEYLTYKTWGVRYAPDVVATLFIQNDPADNWKPYALDKARPFLVPEGDSLRLDDSFAADPGFKKWAQPNWLRQHSALWMAAKSALDKLRARRQPPRLVNGEVQDGYYRAWNFDARVPPDSIAAFRVTARVLARFAGEVAADGRRFVLFSAGFAQQEDRALLAANLRNPDFDANKTPRWLLQLGARDGFAVVPLSPAFRAASVAANGGHLWFGRDSLFGHWNSAGHAVAAAAMARYFARTLPGLDTTGTTPADVPGLAELERTARR